jgi:class 3 adenylate cyclase/plastocyanin
MSGRKTVRMPKSCNPSNNQKYFDPRFVTIQRGETIDWINDDNKVHTILSHKFGQATDLLRVGPITPGKMQSAAINYGVSKIDYFCSIHPEELGTIVILEKKEEDLTNTERIRMLSNVSEYKPPDIMAHLDSPERKAREEALEGLEQPSALVKYFDPLTFEMLLNPPKYKLQNKCLSIVFWDISGFSSMCNQFVTNPSAVVLLLRKYFNEANRIIHKNNGILDKFIGDGIMAYFGYYYNYEVQGAINSINAALALKEQFTILKNEWIEELNLGGKNIVINVKCGIHTGDLLFGIIETDYRNQITAIGKTVNFASMLEGEAKEDEILISAETKEKVKNIFTFDERIVEIQSWGEVKVYVVTGRKNS